jgi:predicted RNA-binding Zn-ribbon protein involved in translation (DUF1610 family)
MSAESDIRGDASYYVAVECPNCGELATIPLRLDVRLERTRDESKLGLKAGQKKVDHRCGQTSLTIVSETGEIVQLGIDGTP